MEAKSGTLPSADGAPTRPRLVHLTRALSAFLGRGVGTRRVARVWVDCLIWAIALYAGLSLRLDFDLHRMTSFDVVVLVPIAWLATVGFGYICGLYRGWWTLGSFEEVPALGLCATLTTVILIMVDIAASDRLAPVTSIVAAGLIAFVAMGGVRHFLRRAVDHHRRARGDGRVPAIVFGAGEGGRAHRAVDAVRDGQPVPPGRGARRRPAQAEPLGPRRARRRRPQRARRGREAHERRRARHRGPHR